MAKIIDDFLNQITMYRLILYYLIGLVLVSVIYSSFHLLAFNPVNIILSSLFLVFFSGFVNDLLAVIFDAPTNSESVYITALILALIITPVKTIADFVFLAFAAMLAMASKYILAVNKKHLFNPAAMAVVLTAFFLKQSASWWVGSLSLLPYVVIGGLLVARKTQKEEMILTFVLSAAVTLAGFAIIKGSSPLGALTTMFLNSSLFFFAFVMLTEPLTMPNTFWRQMIFAVIVGYLFVPNVNLFGVYSTPELALIVGNFFAYIVNPKTKLVLKLQSKIALTPDTYDFIFPLQNKINFVPGQYMEWTLAHKGVDGRGNRRYFTLASSPTENNLRIGVKFYQPASSYKKQMLSMNETTPIVASQIAGDFTLPVDKNKKIAFIAGGIGITPYRSMIKYLIDRGERRNIILFYSNKDRSEIVYQDVFNEAQSKLGIKTVYTLTDINQIPADWIGKKGRVNEEMIRTEIPDFMERTFYLSGPRRMVVGFEQTLKAMNVKDENIKIDFFPGFV
ncbi:oxidoreductase [Patescibacteria group bacterium]|nr:oxidoreductase [Patescibacteria group bacterium]